MIKVGQTLWEIHAKTKNEESVKVVHVSDTHFTVQYEGKTGQYPLSDINIRFFTSPQRKSKPSCDNCFLRYSGACTSLSNDICDDYRARTIIPKNETESWPKYGDAIAIRKKDYNHFK